MAGAKNQLGDMLERMGKQKKTNKSKKSSKLGQTKTPAWMSKRNEIGYIVENGLDRKDADLYREDYNEFRNRIDNMVRNNEGKAMQQGQKSIYYPLLRKKK